VSDDRERLVEFLGSHLARWKPWITPSGVSPQRDFIKSAGTHKVRMFRGGNRSGKSSCGAWDHAAIACGMHPFYPKRGPTKGWIVGVDWGQGIGAVIWPKLKALLPPSQIRSISYMRRAAPEIPQAIMLKNGSEIFFKSAESGRDKLQGADLDWCWLDEEIEAGLVEELRARLLDRGGLFSVTLTPVSNMRWVEALESEKDKHGNPSTLVVRASMRDAMEAGILDREQVERFLANLPEHKRRVRELGDFASAEGLVYQEFDRARHVLRPRASGLHDAEGRWVYPWPLPRSWPRYAAMDFGFSVPSAVVIAAEDPYSGHLVVERCLYAREIRASKWAYELRHPLGLRLLPDLEVPLITDHDAMERAELAAAGIPTCKAVKDKTPGIESVERALHAMPDGRPKLQVVLAETDATASRNSLTGRDDAYHLVWEIERYRYAERKEKGPDAKDEPVKKDDHLMDAMRYLTYFLERRNAGDAPRMPLAYPPDSPFGDITPNNPWK
jgi:phage terminase large subunit-like protein